MLKYCLVAEKRLKRGEEKGAKQDLESHVLFCFCLFCDEKASTKRSVVLSLTGDGFVFKGPENET